MARVLLNGWNAERVPGIGAEIAAVAQRKPASPPRHATAFKNMFRHMTKIKNAVLKFLFSAAEGHHLRQNARFLMISVVLGSIISGVFGVLLYILNKEQRF
ncbi:MAG: hypothetical protein JWR26_2429 [Pedosphaera sp.]|nr:hypothetical protein [Pedosphaera sp.]